MWNRKKDEEYAPRPASGSPAPSETAKEGIPMSTQPTRPIEPHHSDSRAAAFGKSVLIKGAIISREDLTIDGEVEGTVELQEHRLTVGPNGKVRATIKAREVVVLGSIQGNVETSDRIDIRKEAKLVGDIRTARIVIEDGAYFKGNIDIVRAETARQAQTPAPKPQAVATASAASAAAAGAGDNKR
jgi:cytoskeletal protein CcmA (bactofilin family)